MGSIISVCATKPADKALKIPSDLAPGLTAFYQIAGPAGKLQRHELESLLKAIGMRKSVLALALVPELTRSNDTMIAWATA